MPLLTDCEYTFPTCLFSQWSNVREWKITETSAVLSGKGLVILTLALRSDDICIFVMLPL